MRGNQVVYYAVGLSAVFAALYMFSGVLSTHKQTAIERQRQYLSPLDKVSSQLGRLLSLDRRWTLLAAHARGADDMDAEHVLVTGAAGFIGSHAVLRLLEEGYAVTGVDNFSRGNRGAIDVLDDMAAPGQFLFIEMDLGLEADVHSLFSHGNFDAVLHFAAVAYVGESVAEPMRYYKNITANTLSILEAAEQNSVPRFVYSSTCAVYGSPSKMPITETTPLQPVSPYGASKLAAETAVADMASRPGAVFGAAVLRYFNVIGSDPEGRLGEAPAPALARKHGRISNACFDTALGIRPHLELYGTDFPTSDGTAVRDYIHVTDLVNAHLAVLEKIEIGKVLRFNVAVGHGYSVREFTEACRRVTGADIVVKEHPRRPGDAAEVFADASAIKKALGWKAEHASLDEALKAAWKWQRAHPKGYADRQ